jgi:hypothetical protein
MFILQFSNTFEHFIKIINKTKIIIIKIIII